MIQNKERIGELEMNEVMHVGRVTLGNKCRRAVWNVVRILLFRPLGTRLFNGWRCCLLRLFGAHIAKGATVYASAHIWAPWMLCMERGACLGPHTICYNQAMVTLGTDVVVSQYAYLCTAGHDSKKPNSANEGLVTAAITIEQRAWIGTRAFVGMGVRIGKDAIVGATASVYRDVEAATVVGGNPARKLKDRQLEDADGVTCL